MTVKQRKRDHWEFSKLIVEAEEFYNSLLTSIATAQYSIDLECYIFELDGLGERFVEALAEAAGRGVRVRVLVDGVGSMAASERLAGILFRRGVSVQIFHPMPWLTGSYRWSRGHGGWLYRFLGLLLNINRRNHRKLCVVDNLTAWVGSFNISTVHLSRASGGQGWRDYALELRGEDVDSLMQGFNRIWEAQASRIHRGLISRYLTNRGVRARLFRNRFVSRNVSGASKRVWLVSAYFAPTAKFRRALLWACRSGSDVRLLLPGQSDVVIFPDLSSHYYRELLRAGARIFLYQPGVLHAKALLIDDFLILGSSNWNYRSTLHDLELDVIVRSDETVTHLESTMIEDFEQSRELYLVDTKRPNLVSWLWYALRYWM